MEYQTRIPTQRTNKKDETGKFSDEIYRLLIKRIVQMEQYRNQYNEGLREYLEKYGDVDGEVMWDVEPKAKRIITNEKFCERLVNAYSAALQGIKAKLDIDSYLSGD